MAEDDLSRPFERSIAPLMRATLITAIDSSVLVLTFDHTIADGISALRVLNDLVVALNGRSLPTLRMPTALEDMITRPLAAAAESAVDARMHRSTATRPYDGAAPRLRTITMDVAPTERLAQRCRAEETTVHAAITTATSYVRAALCGEEYVRVLTPINIRGDIGAGDDCCLYITCSCTGMSPREGGFWEQAREVTAQLAAARSAQGISATSSAVQHFLPAEADAAAAEKFFTVTAPWDQLISNLGIQELDDTGPIRPTALWGPLVRTHIRGDAGIGVLTYQGRLRMISCGYTSAPGYLKGIVAVLADMTR